LQIAKSAPLALGISHLTNVTDSENGLGTSSAELPLKGLAIRSIFVSLDDEILARIRASKVWNKESRPEHFQIKAHENGLVLINIKTGWAQLLYDEDSALHDWKELFPNVLLLPERERCRDPER
jgi:hypothetical protein